jgi:hypothetical protein
MLARPWSAIVRVPTADGEAWFKENAPASAFEPALTELLAETRPNALPETIAYEGPRILTKDVGPRLRNVLDAGAKEPSWEEILPLYAELQIAFMELAGRALELATPDDRPELLPERYAALGGDRLDVVGAAAERLAGSLPPTVAHMEAHDGNIFVRDGDPVFIDWAEAVVTHPFVGTLLTLRSATERLGYDPGSSEVDRLRDLYLEPFTTFAPIAELQQLFADGYLLFPISRADSWRRTLEGAPVPAEFGGRVSAWLEILAEIADGTTTLGGA